MASNLRSVSARMLSGTLKIEGSLRRRISSLTVEKARLMRVYITGLQQQVEQSPCFTTIKSVESPRHPSLTVLHPCLPGWIELQLSMKFERQRSPQTPTNKYQLTNQQFLTFRNNPVTENSGRTVYSQQLDYRSLDRYQKPQPSHDQHFNFHKNIKNMRSIDKYKQLREEALLFQTAEENSQSQMGSVERREELKVRLAKLKKGLKREQKKELALEEQISKWEYSIQQTNQANCKLQNDIKQLTQILKDNDRNIHLLTRKLEEYKAEERSLISRKSYCDSTIQGQLKSNRVQEHSTLQYQKKLLLGIEGLEDYVQQLQEETSYFQAQIERLQANLSALGTLDLQLRQALSK